MASPSATFSTPRRGRGGASSLLTPRAISRRNSRASSRSRRAPGHSARRVGTLGTPRQGAGVIPGRVSSTPIIYVPGQSEGAALSRPRTVGKLARIEDYSATILRRWPVSSGRMWMMTLVCFTQFGRTRFAARSPFGSSVQGLEVLVKGAPESVRGLLRRVPDWYDSAH